MLSIDKKNNDNIIITTIATPEDIYKAFVNRTIVAFAFNHAFINAKFKTTFNKITIDIQGFSTTPSYFDVKWNEIECTPHSNYNYIKKSPCTKGDPRNTIIFYKNAKNLKDYIIQLHNHKIGFDEHNILFVETLQLLKKQFINHNTEIEFLHFKTNKVVDYHYNTFVNAKNIKNNTLPNTNKSKTRNSRLDNQGITQHSKLFRLPYITKQITNNLTSGKALSKKKMTTKIRYLPPIYVNHNRREIHQINMPFNLMKSIFTHDFNLLLIFVILITLSLISMR